VQLQIPTRTGSPTTLIRSCPQAHDAVRDVLMTSSSTQPWS
jgi:hypothetical protein